MEFYDSLFSAVVNILSLYVNIRVIKLFLNQKSDIMERYYIIYGFVWIGNWSVYYIFNIPLWTILSMYVGLLIISVLFYEGSLVRKFAVATAALATNIVTEDIVWKVLNSKWVQVESAAIGSICSVLFELVIVLVVEKSINFDKDASIPKESYTNMIFLSMGSIVISEVILLGNFLDNYVPLIGLSILCLMNVSTYYLYERVTEAYKEKVEKTSMEQQITMYVNQFDIISQSQRNIRALRHDIKNHLLLLNIYLQKGKYEEAQKYLGEIECLENVPTEHVKTGNLEIDSILNYKLERIKELGCKLDVKIDIPNRNFISCLDLNILLGNLLDNSIEALQKASEKYFSIRLTFSRGLLYISIYNSFSGIIKRNGKKIVSLKKDKDNHGIGLSNVDCIVKKYDGTIKISDEDGLYKVDILLYTKMMS